MIAIDKILTYLIEIFGCFVTTVRLMAYNVQLAGNVLSLEYYKLVIRAVQKNFRPIKITQPFPMRLNSTSD